MNTNALSVMFLRATGWNADIVQRQRQRFSQDLFGIGDVLCFRRMEGEVRLLNACRAGHDLRAHQAHYNNIPMLGAWIARENRTFCLYAWARAKPRGKRAYLYLTVWRAISLGWWTDKVRWTIQGVYACRMDGRPIPSDQNTHVTLVPQKPK